MYATERSHHVGLELVRSLQYDYINFNPFMLNVFSHPYQLDVSISNFIGVFHDIVRFCPNSNNIL